MDIFAPAQWLADRATYDWLGIGAQSYLGHAVNFFVYDVIKITLLLIVINFVMAVTRYYFPIEKVRDILTRRRWYGLDYLLAALLGVVTPFCACSSIPLFIGFLGAGIPLGVTFAFLISSPLVNEASLALFPAMFGMEVTVAYHVVGIAISMAGGYLIQRLRLERFVDQTLLKLRPGQNAPTEKGKPAPPLRARLRFWFADGMAITREVLPYVVLGVSIGALIHGFVPASLIERTLANPAWFMVPLATIIGVPLYANSVSVIPVMEALVGKGVPIGTALAFMTATVTLALPQAMILKKVMRWQLLFAFYGITIVGIILMGYLFNWLF